MASSSERDGTTSPGNSGSEAADPSVDERATGGGSDADSDTRRRFRSILVGAVTPAAAVTLFVVGAGTVDGWHLFLASCALLLVGGVGFGWWVDTGGWGAFGHSFAGVALGLPAGFVAAGVVVSVQNGFDVAHLGASLFVFVLVGGIVPLLLLPYSVVAGLTSAAVTQF